jgi:hypothetical protein
MCAQRMLRAGPSADIVTNPPDRPRDERQGLLDPNATNAKRMIFRLSHENAQLTSRLARAGLTTAIDNPLYPADCRMKRMNRSRLPLRPTSR